MDTWDWPFGTPLPSILAICGSQMAVVAHFYHRKQYEIPLSRSVVAAVATHVLEVVKAVMFAAMQDRFNIAFTDTKAWLDSPNDYALVLIAIACVQAITASMFLLLFLFVAVTDIVEKRNKASELAWAFLFASLAAVYAGICNLEWAWVYVDNSLEYKVWGVHAHIAAWLGLVVIACAAVRQWIRE